MKIELLILLYLLSSDFIFAQVNSKDFFPLNIGNTWVYKYYDSDTESPSDVTNTYYGSATYRIVFQTESPDSIIWNFEEMRDVTHIHYVYGDNNRDTTFVADTNYFDLIEYKNGNHRLIIPSAHINPFNFLCEPYSDSLQFSRYAPDSLEDTLAISKIWINGLRSISGQFKNTVGVINISYLNHYPTGVWDYAYDSLLNFTILSVPVNKNDYKPEFFILEQNYPNPFNPSTTIRFDLKCASKVTLGVYNVLGQNIREWNYGMMDAGRYDETLTMEKFASGVYYYRITVLGNNGERFVSVKELVLMK